MQLAEYVDVIGNLGALGIVFWLVQRTFSHTIPRLSGDFTDAIKESREDFKEVLREQSTAFHASMRHQQDYFADQIAQERDHTTTVLNTFRSAFVVRDSLMPARPNKKPSSSEK